VVEVKELVVEVLIGVTGGLELVEVGGNVTHFIKVLGSHLTDMEID